MKVLGVLLVLGATVAGLVGVATVVTTGYNTYTINANVLPELDEIKESQQDKVFCQNLPITNTTLGIKYSAQGSCFELAPLPPSSPSGPMNMTMFSLLDTRLTDIESKVPFNDSMLWSEIADLWTEINNVPHGPFANETFLQLQIDDLRTRLSIVEGLVPHNDSILRIRVESLETSLQRITNSSTCDSCSVYNDSVIQNSLDELTDQVNNLNISSSGGSCVQCQGAEYNDTEIRQQIQQLQSLNTSCSQCESSVPYNDTSLVLQITNLHELVQTMGNGTCNNCVSSVYNDTGLQMQIDDLNERVNGLGQNSSCEMCPGSTYNDTFVLLTLIDLQLQLDSIPTDNDTALQLQVDQIRIELDALILEVSMLDPLNGTTIYLALQHLQFQIDAIQGYNDSAVLAALALLQIRLDGLEVNSSNCLLQLFEIQIQLINLTNVVSQMDIHFTTLIDSLQLQINSLSTLVLAFAPYNDTHILNQFLFLQAQIDLFHEYNDTAIVLQIISLQAQVILLQNTLLDVQVNVTLVQATIAQLTLDLISINASMELLQLQDVFLQNQLIDLSFDIQALQISMTSHNNRLLELEEHSLRLCDGVTVGPQPSLIGIQPSGCIDLAVVEVSDTVNNLQSQIDILKAQVLVLQNTAVHVCTGVPPVAGQFLRYSNILSCWMPSTLELFEGVIRIDGYLSSGVPTLLNIPISSTYTLYNITYPGTLVLATDITDLPEGIAHSASSVYNSTSGMFIENHIGVLYLWRIKYRVLRTGGILSAALEVRITITNPLTGFIEATSISSVLDDDPTYVSNMFTVATATSVPPAYGGTGSGYRIGVVVTSRQVTSVQIISVMRASFSKFT